MREDLFFLRAEFQHPQRRALLKTTHNALQSHPFDFVRRAFFLDALQPALSLLEVGKDQFFLDTPESRHQVAAADSGTGDRDENRVQFAHHRDERGVEDGSRLRFFLAGRKIEHRQFDGNFLFGFTDPLKEVQPRIGNPNLSRARAISGLCRWKRGQAS